MTKFFIAVFFFFGLSLGGADEAFACDCAGRGQGVKGFRPCGSYWSAGAVFTGLAEKVTIENGQMKVSFAVEKPIRGVTAKTVEVFTSANEASCGYPFKAGERYFVYAGKASNGSLGEGLCGATTLLKDAEEDLAYASGLEAGKFGSRIFGTVYEDRQKRAADKRTFEKLAGIEITIKGETGKNNFKTKTDENGFYIFREIPPDIYRITAKFPPGLREIVTREDLIDHFAVIYKDNIRCKGEDFVTTRQGSIRGKIVGADNKVPEQQKMSLFLLDENSNIIPNRTAAEKYVNRETGEYFFNVVTAGKYLLSINPNNCPSPTNGFPTMYFPGVADKSASKIITVREGENLKLEDFRILSMLKKRWFAGVVFNADKTPAANVTVRLLDANMSQCNNFFLEAKTDETGRFRLEGFETYAYQISAFTERKQGQKTFYAKPFLTPQFGMVEDIQLLLEMSF